jgi:hypothetical protein
MSAYLIVCQVPLPSDSQVRASSPWVSAPLLHGPLVSRLNSTRRGHGQLRAIRANSQRRTGRQHQGPVLVCPAPSLDRHHLVADSARDPTWPRVRAYLVCPAELRWPTTITTSRARARPKRPPPRDLVRQDPILTQTCASSAWDYGTGQQELHTDYIQITYRIHTTTYSIFQN